VSTALEAAHKIMALVDEFPSEPFSYERKVILEKLEDLVAQHTQQVDDELDESFNLGFSEGERSGESQAREELRDEYESQIEELKDNLSEAEEEIRRAYDEGFAAGTQIQGH